MAAEPDRPFRAAARVDSLSVKSVTAVALAAILGLVFGQLQVNCPEEGFDGVC